MRDFLLRYSEGLTGAQHGGELSDDRRDAVKLTHDDTLPSLDFERDLGELGQTGDVLEGRGFQGGALFDRMLVKKCRLGQLRRNLARCSLHCAPKKQQKSMKTRVWQEQNRSSKSSFTVKDLYWVDWFQILVNQGTGYHV